MPGRIIFWAAPLLVPVLFFIVWESMATLVGNSLILPPLEEIGALLAHPLDNVIAMGTLAGNIGISLVRVLCGYAAAVLLGVPLGVAMGYYAGLHRLLNLFLGMFRPIPPLAWVPLVLAWFGVSSLATAMGLPRSELYYYLNNLKISMLFIIFIGALFPILTSAVHGVQTVNRTLVDSARVLGASERDIFTKILLPAAAPSIVNGLRIGLGVAWMCLVSAEMLPGSLSGGLSDHACLYRGTYGRGHCRHDQHQCGGSLAGYGFSVDRATQVCVETVFPVGAYDGECAFCPKGAQALSPA